MMPAPRIPRTASALAATLLAVVVASARLPAQDTTATPAHDFTPADVAFVQGMIVHHAQAVVMSGWCATHGARPDLQILCKRIALSQRDEITMMQTWLQTRHLAVPDPLHMLHGASAPVHDRSTMHMPGMDMGDHPMMMEGMLTPAQMRALDAAHGPQFGRLYLTGMIAHHRGAIDMVKKLLATPGAGQQPELFTFATDVDAGQRAEIGRMQAILATLNPAHTR